MVVEENSDDECDPLETFCTADEFFSQSDFQ